MSEEQRKDELEVEGHVTRPGANDEPVEDDEDEVEAHLVNRYPTVRMD
jgi:hypothetical protein